MRRKKQVGSIVRIGSRWFLRFWEARLVNGVVERHRASYLLGDVTTRGKTPPWEIKEAAEKKMNEINEQRNSSPNPTMTVHEFFESVYIPWIYRHRRPSTAAMLKYHWQAHLKPVIGRKVLLRAVTTSIAQNWLDQMAVNRWQRRAGSDPRCQGLEQLEPLSKNTMKHLKSTLSGAFRLAIQKDCYADGNKNPMQQTSIPPEAVSESETCAYTLDELLLLLAILPEPASTAVAIAGFAGLRRGEIEGLSWQDLHHGNIWVNRSMWNGRENEPKTETSKAPVPIIPQLQTRLDMHRLRCGEPDSGPVFTVPRCKGKVGEVISAREQGQSQTLASVCGTLKYVDVNRASLQNMLHRVILPVLKRCKYCGKQSGKAHLPENHAYLRDDSIPDWRGWHAFRRGLATNLYSLGVPDLLIQRILRHSNVSTTQDCYIKTPPKDVTDAMQKLAQKLEEKTLGHALSDSNRTVNPASDAKPESVN